MSISGLLIWLPTCNSTNGIIDFNTSKLHPILDEVDVTIMGNPTVVPGPVMNGIRLTAGDRVLYKFSVSPPWPCPFDINQCPTGFTLSFWLRWKYVVNPHFSMYIQLGNTLQIYRWERDTKKHISLRWNLHWRFSWYFGTYIVADEWILLTWMLNHTHSVGYLNGLKRYTQLKENRRQVVSISNELHINPRGNAGDFSIGPIQVWSGRKSPVFLWRLYQEGLRNDDHY